MRFDLVAAIFALGSFGVLAFAPSPSLESIGASAACALIALVTWLRPVRQAKGSPAQVSPGASAQQGRPPASTPVEEVRSAAYLDRPHSALLMPVEALKQGR